MGNGRVHHEQFDTVLVLEDCFYQILLGHVVVSMGDQDVIGLEHSVHSIAKETDRSMPGMDYSQAAKYI